MDCCDPDASVANFEDQTLIAPFGIDVDASAFSKFDCVADQVDQNLSNPQAIAHQARVSDPRRRVMYLTVERFAFQFISALREKLGSCI